MKPYFKCILIGGFMIIAFIAKAQDSIAYYTPVDTISTVVEEEKKQAPPPRIATMYSAVLPGLGQVYNHQWWKVPFIYGGFAAIGYMAYNYNNAKNIALQAYWDIADKNPATDIYRRFSNIPDDFNELDDDASAYRTQFENAIKTNTDKRNTYLIIAAGFYLFNILDANVAAHFLDFDISEDLSLNLSPSMIRPVYDKPVPGMTLVFNF